MANVTSNSALALTELRHRCSCSAARSSRTLWIRGSFQPKPARQLLGQRGRGEFLLDAQLDLLYRHSWPTRAAARSAIFEHIEGFYNLERRHTLLGDLSPADYESQHATVCSA